MLKQMRKTLGILLVVCFLMSVTAAAVSAGPVVVKDKKTAVLIFQHVKTKIFGHHHKLHHHHKGHHHHHHHHKLMKAVKKFMDSWIPILSYHPNRNAQKPIKSFELPVIATSMPSKMIICRQTGKSIKI